MGTSTGTADPRTVIPPPPDGFTETVDSPAVSAIPPPPEGFSESVQSAIPPPPEGFTEDASEQPMPGVMEAARQGLSSAITANVQTANLATGSPDAPEAPLSPAAQPFGWSDIANPLSKLAPKMAYKLAESSPTIGAGFAGAVPGEAFGGPIGGILGGGAGAAVGAAAQTLGPAFKQELAKTPQDPDGAFTRAMNTTLNSGTFSAAGWMLGGVPFLQTPVKNLLFQTFGVQPAVMGAQQASQNVISGQPVDTGVGQAMIEGGIIGAPIVAAHSGAHAVANKITTGSFFPTDRPGTVAGREDAVNLPMPDVPPPPGFSEPVAPQGPAPAGPTIAMTAEEAAQRGLNEGDTFTPPDPEQQASSVPPLAAMRATASAVDRTNQDQANPPDVPAVLDAAETSPALEPVIAELRRQLLQDPFYDAQVQSRLDNATDRYVYGNGEDFHMYNATDLEHVQAMEGNQKKPPLLQKVDLASLDPERISANVTDLPPSNSRRVMWNSRELQPQEREAYDLLQQLPDDQTKLDLYQQMVQKGLRVVPSSGSSFMYGGNFRSEPLKAGEIPSSARADYVFRQTEDGSQQLVRDPQAIPEEMTGWSTVDMNKVDPKNFVSMDPGRSRDVAFDEGVQQRWKDAATAGDVATILEMAKQGVSAKPRMDSKGQWTDSAVAPLKPIENGDLVGAYSPMDENEKRSLAWMTGDTAAAGSNLGVQINYPTQLHMENTPERLKKKGDEIAQILQENQPLIDSVLSRFGAKNRPTIMVDMAPLSELPHFSPDVRFGPGLIRFPADFERGFQSRGINFFGTTKDNVQQILWHELGHIVTVRSWYALPPDVQQMVRGAYNRSRLLYNLTEDPSSSNSMLAPGRPASETNARAYDNAYYLTFPEWQAEQFRRWMNSDQKTLSAVDVHLKDGMQEIIAYRNIMRDRLGPAIENQMFQSDWAFNSWMDYLEQSAHGPDQGLQYARFIDKMALQRPENGDLEAAYTAASQMLDELKNIIPSDVVTEVSPQDRVSPAEAIYASFSKEKRILRLFAGSLAWVADRNDMSGAAKELVLHEAWHSVEDSIPESQTRLLWETAKAEQTISKAQASRYFRTYFDYYKSIGIDRVEAKLAADKLVRSEYVAALVTNHHYGWRYNDQAQGILDRLSGFFERVGNMLQGKGFNTAQDILHSYYRGEVTRRYNKAIRDEARAKSSPPNQHIQGDLLQGLPKVTTERGLQLSVLQSHDEEGNSRHTFYDPQGKLVGTLDVDGKGEIQGIEVRERKYFGQGIPAAMLAHAEPQVPGGFKTAQMLTNAGYKMVSRLNPDGVKYYVKSGDLWYSPKFIWEGVDRNTRLKARGVNLSEDNLRFWKDLAAKIPDTAAEDPALLKQWASRRLMTDEWQKANDYESGSLKARVTGDTSSGVDNPYDFIQAQSTQQARKASPWDSAPQPELYSMRGVFRRYGDRNPEVRRRLYGTTRGTENDSTYSFHVGSKLISLGKQALMIRQLAWKNPHIPQLNNYVSLRDQQNQRVQSWVSRAAERASDWDRIPEVQRDGLSNLLFWATEMRYRTPAEVRSRVTRQPTPVEVAREAQRLQLTPETMRLYDSVRGDFSDYLDDMQRVFGQQIQRRWMSNPQEMQIQLTKLAADMQALRAKPYFPMTRFGKYSLTARQAGGRAVRYFGLYATPAERDAAVVQVHRQFGGLADISISKVPEEMYDWMGLPQPLLERIRDQMQPQLNAAQVDWINRFAQLNAPESSFKKRWLNRKGTAGYSLDGIRAYAQYFRSGSRYLSRIEFGDQIRDTINDLDASVTRAADGTSRQVIADTVKSHAAWMDKPGKDWQKLKVMTTLFQLGFSPAAAMMNFTQVPAVTYPYLSSLFGEKAVLELGKDVAHAGSRTLFTRNPIADPSLAKAHAEMVRQGRIDIGQAAELGSYADSDRLDRSYVGSRTQQALRTASYWSMWMFGKSERFNREWSFETAYKLALKDMNNQHVIDLVTRKHQDWADLMSRGFNSDEASAFIVAREAIDRTQGIYQAWDRPAMLRGPVAQASRIFFMYTQQMLFAMANNPGRLKMLLIQGALYGAMGLPFSDDIDALIHAISSKIFGKDFEPKTEARKLVHALTQGSFLEHVGPDLFLHGISRYSFGTSMLSEFMGWPQFDASANGSMGKIVPGFADLMNGIATSGSDPDHWKDVSTQVLQDLAGPGVGLFFPWMQYMNSAPYGGDQKKWEAILPRALKAAAKAAHDYAAGGIQNKQGAVTIKLDPQDPDDRATIIAQALGLTPRAQNEAFEQYEMANNTDTFYKAKKMELTVDLFRALRLNDQDAQRQVLLGIQDYNKEVMSKPGLSGEVIQGRQLLSSLKERIKNNAKAEAGLPMNKSQFPLQQETQKYFPGIIERKKVQ